MKSFTAVVERCPDTGLYVGYVTGFAGAPSQAASLDELRHNLEEVIAMLLEDGQPALQAPGKATTRFTVSNHFGATSAVRLTGKRAAAR